MPSGWPPCEQCGGAAVVGEHCIGHLTHSQLISYMGTVSETGIIDGRGATCTAADVAKLLSARGEPVGAPTVLMFERAVIKGNFVAPLTVTLFASFKDAIFAGDVSTRLDAGCPVDFTGTQFRGDVKLRGTAAHNMRFLAAEFDGALSFKASRIAGSAQFASARFAGRVDLTRLKVDGGIEFSGTTFPAEFVWSGGGACDGRGDGLGIVTGERIRAEDGSWWDPLPEQAREELVPLLAPELQDLLDEPVDSGARFSDVVFESRARFDHVFVGGRECTLVDVRFRDVFDFQEATLGGVHTVIRSSQFEQRLSVGVGGANFDCLSNTFADGADLYVLSQSVAVEDCRFGRSSVIRSWMRHAGKFRSTRLVSLRRTDCEHLRLLNMDLSPCLFAGTHNLDKLVIEDTLLLESPPPPRRADRRKIIAEEWHWRTDNDGWEQPLHVAWKRLELERPAPLAEPVPLTTTEIAAIYRALRKGSEDAKDEPGAADFYYGEMEMRRRTSGGPQRFILWAYWLLSGYALRPSRVMASLVVVLALFAALFQWGGFQEGGTQLRAVRLDPGGVPVYEERKPEKTSAVEDGIDAVVYTAGTAATIISGPERPLNRLGRVLRVILRILAPVLIALLVLSIRGRVKR